MRTDAKKTLFLTIRVKEEKHFNNEEQKMQNLSQLFEQDQMVSLKAECEKFMPNRLNHSMSLASKCFLAIFKKEGRNVTKNNNLNILKYFYKEEQLKEINLTA